MRDADHPLRSDPWTWVGVLCAIAFVILAAEVNEREAFAFDASVTSFVQGLPVSTDVWSAITQLGAGVILVPLGIAFVVALLLLRRPHTAAIVGIAIAGASLWTSVIKVSVARVRPSGAEVLAEGFSFPSGHTLNSTVTYGLIALFVWRSGLRAWARWLVAVALTALVVLIGLSRIALGVHYPTDVVGGWLAGLAIVAIVAVTTRGADAGEASHAA